MTQEEMHSYFQIAEKLALRYREIDFSNADLDKRVEIWDSFWKNLAYLSNRGGNNPLLDSLMYGVADWIANIEKGFPLTTEGEGENT